MGIWVVGGLLGQREGEASKIAGADLRSLIAGPGAFLGGRGSESPSPKETACSPSRATGYSSGHFGAIVPAASLEIGLGP